MQATELFGPEVQFSLDWESSVGEGKHGARDRDRRRVSVSETTGWRLKHDSALKRIHQLELDKRVLQTEVSKLKLNLALKESAFVSQTEVATPLGPKISFESKKEEEEDSLFFPSAAHCEQYGESQEDKDKLDGADIFHSLIESESFQQVGSGTSVLDQLSAECRSDVLMSYCRILETLLDNL